MLTGHASHQIASTPIWLTPMPRRSLTTEEREMTSAVNMVARRPARQIDPGHLDARPPAGIRAAATDPAVERVLVNAAIKKALCREAGSDRSLLSRVRPVPATTTPHAHSHRLPGRQRRMPAADPPPTSDGCGASSTGGFTEEVLNPRPNPNWRPPPPVTMAQLQPEACRQVLGGALQRPPQPPHVRRDRRRWATGRSLIGRLMRPEPMQKRMLRYT